MTLSMKRGRAVERRNRDMYIDMEMEMGCVQCGCVFKDSFMDMPHGRPLLCPFCLSAEVELSAETYTERDATQDGFEGRCGHAALERKPEEK